MVIGAAIALLTALIGAGLGWAIAMRKARRQAAKQLQHAEAARQQLLLQLGHEARNPLNAVLGLADQLLATPLTGEQRQNVVVIHSAAENLSGLVSNLLTTAKPSLTAVEARFSVAESIKEIESRLAQTARAKGLHFEVHLERGAPSYAVGDEARFAEIARNVIGHALAVSESGGVEVTLHATEPGKTAGVTMTVQDRSQKLPPEQAELAFQPFGLERVLPGGCPPGVGMHLYAARLSARLAGGDVRIVDRPVAGNLYELTLPWRIQSEVAAHKAESPTVVSIGDLYARHKARVPSMRILVAEDQASNQHFITTTLARAGHTSVLVTSGDDVLERLGSDGDFDAVVLDLRLPGTNGLDVLKLSRFAVSQEAPPPFIVVTGEASDDIRQASLSAGASHFLVKPIAAQLLLEALAAVHEGGQHEREDFGLADSTAIAPAVASNVPPRVIMECMRDALRYLADAETAGTLSQWETVLQRVRAIRGAAVMVGAIEVVNCCRRILSGSNQLEQNWRIQLDELNGRVEEARRALSSMVAAARS